MKRSYKFYSDSSHGWLKVPVKDVISLAILRDITPYSYLSKDKLFIFLEEDQDLGLFMGAAISEGWKVSIKDQKPSNRSRIRNYLRFYIDEL